MKVNICGIPHEVIEKQDVFNSDTTHFGQIDYVACEITLNKNMPSELKIQTLIHEMLHGIFTHLGYEELACDEKLITTLATAMSQGFLVRRYQE